ncbi:MAG: TerB family tellurite resistance protein [Hyphomicrobiaceae bacterium]
MHILAGLLSALAVIGVIVYRLYMISQSRMGQDLADAAGGVQKHLRRRSWQKKLGDPLRDIDDARVAATAMMVALAQSDSPLSEREEGVISALMKTNFETDDKLTGELLAHARWLVRDVTEPENCFRKVKPVILASCGEKERAELIEMMNAVAAAGSAPEDQKAVVARLAHILKS